MRQFVLHGMAYLLAVACAAAFSLDVRAADAPALDIRIGYLGYTPDPGPLLSNVIPEPTDAGLRGAELAITDSNSTGRFLKHRYRLDAASTDTPEKLLSQARRLHDAGLRLFVVNAPADTLRQLAAALPDLSLIHI